MLKQIMEIWENWGKWKRTVSVTVAFIIIFIILIPILINCAFKKSCGVFFLEAEWSADAALTFYGTIIAALVAVCGVFLTIQYSQQNYKEDMRNRVLPFIIIEGLYTRSKYDLFSEVASKEDSDDFVGYIEYKLEDYYCILENGDISYKPKLTKNQQELLNHMGTKLVKTRNGYCCMLADDIIVPLTVENVGNGAAVNLRYGLNRADTPEEEQRFLRPVSLKLNHPIKFHIFSEDCGKDSKNLGNYELAFSYEDIYSNQYSQKFDLKIRYDDDKSCPIAQINMESKQERIYKNKK